MKVFVTGVTGFLDTNLVKELFTQKSDVLALYLSCRKFIGSDIIFVISKICNMIKVFFVVFLLFSSVYSNSITIESESGASYNYLGLENSTTFTYNKLLFDSESPLFRNSHISVGAFNILTPATHYIGPYVKFEPIAFFNIIAHAGVKNSFNTFGFGVYDNLDSYDSELTDEDITDELVTSYRLNITPQFKMKIKSIIFTTNFSMNHFIREKETYYYDRKERFIMDNDEYIYGTNNLLLYEISEKHLTGFKNEFYYNPASEHKIGRIYGLYIHPLNKTSFFALGAGTHYIDREHKGDPYFLIGYSKKWEWGL